MDFDFDLKEVFSNEFLNLKVDGILPFRIKTTFPADSYLRCDQSKLQFQYFGDVIYFVLFHLILPISQCFYDVTLDIRNIRFLFLMM